MMVDNKCRSIPKERHKIETLALLNSKLDILFRGIWHDCRNCQDPDCVGFIWLLSSEADQLYAKGIPLVQVNDGPTFLHSFPTKVGGAPDLSIRWPRCIHLCQGVRECNIYTDRPFVCHLYPLGLETQSNGKIVWALHTDCLFVRELEKHELLFSFMQRAKDVIRSVSPRLLEEIISTYREVDAISKFPDGASNYIPLKEV